MPLFKLSPHFLSFPIILVPEIDGTRRKYPFDDDILDIMYSPGISIISSFYPISLIVCDDKAIIEMVITWKAAVIAAERRLRFAAAAVADFVIQRQQELE